MNRINIREHIRKIDAYEYGTLLSSLLYKEHVEHNDKNIRTQGKHPRGCGICIVFRTERSAKFQFYVAQPHPTDSKCDPISCLDSHKCLVSNSIYPLPKKFSKLTLK